MWFDYLIASISSPNYAYQGDRFSFFQRIIENLQMLVDYVRWFLRDFSSWSFIDHESSRLESWIFCNSPWQPLNGLGTWWVYHVWRKGRYRVGKKGPQPRTAFLGSFWSPFPTPLPTPKNVDFGWKKPYPPTPKKGRQKYATLPTPVSVWGPDRHSSSHTC